MLLVLNNRPLIIQSIISLIRSLIEDWLSLTLLTKLIMIIIFAEKLREALALQKLLSFFSAKMAGFMHTVLYRLVDMMLSVKVLELRIR